MLTHVDLFSGIGGFALAAKWEGFKTELFCEIDLFCQKVLKKNFPEVDICENVKDIINLGHTNLITGGFPCQPFSQAGNKRGREDERYLWPEFLRTIKTVRPDWIIVENVIGIIQMEIDNILSDLEREDYKAETFIIPACAANAPHRRDRVWIVAYNNSIGNHKRVCNWEERHIQKNIYRNVEEIQQEWSQFIPHTWKAFKARDYLNYNTGSSRVNDGVSSRLDKSRIKALGNAIVPQVVFPIMKFIASCYVPKI